jgi:hypothetical protein
VGETASVNVFERDEFLEFSTQVIGHRAVLTLPDGMPFGELVETYTGKVLAFPESYRPL